MQERTQDALVYARHYGCPHLFITFTCNPKWVEITKELWEGQKPSDRHDILARVFRQKLIVMINLLTKHKVFGLCKCYIYTIEWQKRGNFIISNVNSQ